MRKLFGKKRSFVLLLSASLFFFVALFLFLGWFFWQPVNREGKEQVFVIRRGEETYQIASRLEENKLIRNRHLFLLVLRQYDLVGKIQAGSFYLSRGMNVKEIAFALTKGRLDKWITIIEGLRREEIAFQVEKELGISEEEFLRASENKEGYLFPDSYLVPLNASAPQLVKIMTGNFQGRTERLWEKAEQEGLSKKEVVIIASLVEREARGQDDRYIVAGILIKRWKNKWPLQVDATVQYAKASLTINGQKEWWSSVSGTDLKLNSPFNTYQHSDLPPAPICNPSLGSMEAVVDYKTTPYWFYLSDVSGKIHFAETLREHQENIDNYLKNK